MHDLNVFKLSLGTLIWLNLSWRKTLINNDKDFCLSKSWQSSKPIADPTDKRVKFVKIAQVRQKKLEIAILLNLLVRRKGTLRRDKRPKDYGLRPAIGQRLGRGLKLLYFSNLFLWCTGIHHNLEMISAVLILLVNTVIFQINFIIITYRSGLNCFCVCLLLRWLTASSPFVTFEKVDKFAYHFTFTFEIEQPNLNYLYNLKFWMRPCDWHESVQLLVINRWKPNIYLNTYLNLKKDSSRFYQDAFKWFFWCFDSEITYDR